MPWLRDRQLADALEEVVQRLRRLRCNGPQRDGQGHLMGLQVTDEGRTGTTFLWEPGESLGEVLDRVDGRFR